MNAERSRLELILLQELRRSLNPEATVPSLAARAMSDQLCELEEAGLIVKSGERYHCLCPDMLDKGIASLQEKLASHGPGGCNRQSIGELR